MANNKVQLANGTVLIDITDTTANASDVLSGEYFYDASGVKTEGSLTIPSTYTVTKNLINVTTNNNDTEVLVGGSFYMDLTPSYGMTINSIAVTMGGVDVTEQVFKAGVGEKTITQNGTYDAEDDWLEGYSEVTVNVPNRYTSADEGKVVSNGSLVSQTSDTVTQNGTVDTTLINSLTVNVSGGSAPTGTKQINITQNGTVTEDVTDYANVEISTNVPDNYFVRVDCSYNFFDNKLYADFSSGTLKRMSFWSKSGTVKPYCYYSSSDKNTRGTYYAWPIPSGATKAKIKIDKSCQCAFVQYAVENNEAVSLISNTGWVNISANTLTEFDLNSSAGAVGISFRYNSSNTAFTGKTTIYDFNLSFD